VLFPDPYQPHGIPIIYDGEEIKLKPEEEEWATYYSQYLTTDHVKKPQFYKNFFHDWLLVLTRNGKKKHVIEEFEKCDFSKIHKFLEERKDKRKSRSKEEKDK